MNAAARQIGNAVLQARSTARQLGDDLPVDVATWDKADLVATPRPRVYSADERNTVMYVTARYETDTYRPVGIYEVQESVRNARTGVTELRRHQLPLGVERSGPVGVAQGPRLGHLTFDELLAMDDPAHADRVLTAFAARVPTPAADPSSPHRMATMVDVIPLRTGGADVHAAHGVLYIPTGQGIDEKHLLRAGLPLPESLLPNRDDAPRVERIVRATPMLANVFDRYGQSNDLWSASSVLVDTTAVARSLGAPS